MYEDETDRIFFARTGADGDAIRRRARQALEGRDDGELFLERASSESLLWEDGRLRTASFDSRQGMALRVVCGEETGFAQANEISEASVARAADALASVAGARPAQPDPSPPGGRNTALYPSEDPALALAFAEKRRLLQGLDERIRAAEPRVRQVSVALATSHQAVQVLRADGEVRADIRPLARLSVSVVLEKDGRRETGTHGIGGRGPFAEVFTSEACEAAADEALRRARVAMEAVPAPAGALPVVLAGGWPGILLHEAVGHGLEGDFNRKNLSAFAALMGEQVAAKGVTVVDDGTLPGRRGSLSMDDEGTPPARTVLIEDGRLVGYMHDRMSARLMGAQTTGNGRRESFACSPMVRMTNTFMEAGSDDPAELLARAEGGIYAVSFGGGQVDITNGDFTFNCTEAYRIRGGLAAEPVKGASLIGSGPEALKKVAGIGHDFALDPGIGTCGKDGQSVPVGVGQPSLLILEMTVGGTERA